MSQGFGLTKRTMFGGAAGVIFLVMLVIVLVGGFGRNDVSDWQIKQSVSGDIEVVNDPGYYLKMFASVWTYPRAYQAEYGTGDSDSGDQTVRVTFNDGGTAQISSMMRFATPKTKDQQLEPHRDFGSIENMASSCRAHLVNCLKASAPLMSSSEHQSARKAEFTQVVDDMLRKGIYQMRQVEVQLKDQVDEAGRPITVLATEIVRDEQTGLPLIAQVSPLEHYGFEVLQYSITATNYDAVTLKKFAAKKESYLRAEQSKADREAEVQERLMVIEKGLRELAQVEAEANKKMKTEVIDAERLSTVARIDAERKVTVAEQTKLEAETAASQKVAVAELELEEAKLIAQTADEQAKAIIILASAEEEKILKAGAITEQEKVLAEIKADRDVRVAEMLAMVKVPQTLLMGGGNGSAGNMQDALINLRLLQTTGIIQLDDAKAEKPIKQDD